MSRVRVTVVVIGLSLLTFSATAGGFSQNQTFHPATPEELSMKSPTGAPAAILDWVRFDDDTDGLTSEYYRIKVFTDEGKKYGSVEAIYFPAYPFFGKVTDISARTLRPDGTAVPFDGKVYDKVVYRSGGATVRAKAFSLADVQAGSILEYRFISRHSSNVLKTTWWSIQQDIPMLHCKLTLRPYKGREFSSYFAYMGLPAGKSPVKSTDHYDLELTDIPAFHSEEFAPPDDQLKPRVQFYYTISRVRPQEFWQSESQQSSKEIERFLGDGKALRETAVQVIGDAPAATEKAMKLYAHVQSLRNLSFDPDGNERQNAKSPLAVLREKAGTAGEINRLFVALARAAGLDSDVMRVAPRDHAFFSDKLPDGDQMSDEVAVITIDGRAVFLDPGTPFAPFGILAWQKTNVPGYRVTRSGPQWMQTPEISRDGAVIRRRAEMRLDDDTLKGTMDITFIGQEALKRRLAMLGLDEAAQKKSIQDEVAGWLPAGARLALTNLSGATSSDLKLSASLDVELPNIASHAGSRLIVPASVFTATKKNPFGPATRTHPIYFPHAWREDDSVRLTVPPSHSIVSVPPAAALDGGALGYKSETSRDGAAVTFTRSMFVDTIFVDRQYYGALRRFFISMAEADQKPIVVQAGK